MFFFSKMQATGNDFIVVNLLENNFNYSLKVLSKFLCDRHFGVGADGVIFMDRSIKADFKMRIFNNDGSEAEMCGNGIRCLGKYIYEKGLIEKEVIKIETLAGIKKLDLQVEGNTVVNVKVNMEKPVFDFDKIPVFNKNRNKSILIDKIEVYPVSFGNPHAICFVNDLNLLEIEKYGKLIENSKYFPYKTNVEFVKIENSSKIKVRVWERGVGETLSCGTGACAAAVISKMYKYTNDELIVDLKGGFLKVNIKNEIELSGKSEFVFDGKIKL